MVTIIKVGDKNAVGKSVEILKRGGIIVFPTETCYGLGADGTNRGAVRKVFKIKRMRPARKISAMVSGKKMAHAWFGKDQRVDALIDAFLPGPLTIVTKGKSFRIPDYAFCRKLVKMLGRPVTATSSNVSGGSDHYSIKKILKEIGGVDLIIDGGNLPKRRPSTVYDVDAGTVLRKGPIAEAEIKGVLHGKG